MKEKYPLSKKIFMSLLVVSISFSGFATQRAHAFWGVGDITYDPANVAQSTITAGSAPVTAGASTAGAATGVASFSWDAVGKNLLDYAAYAAAQNLLNQLTNNTLKWIKGGFHGSPSFEVDIEQTATEIADNIAGNLVLRLRGIASCQFTASYTDDLSNAIYLEPKQRDYIFDNKATCPFQQNWNFTASEFYAGTSRFMWDAFGAALEDGGNPYGLATITAKEKAQREAEAKAKNDKRLSWSNGYADLIDTNSCNYPAGIFRTAGSVTYDENGNERGMTQAEADTFNTQLMADPSFKETQKQYCKTTTPGNVVSDQLTKTLGVDMDRIGFADNMNKIISAFLDMAMQKAIRGVFGTETTSATVGGTTPGGGAVACPVQVFTESAVPGQTSAIISGRVTCSSSEMQANVSPRFRFSTTSFLPTDTTPTLWFPSSALIDDPSTDLTGQTFTATLTGLTAGTTYYFNANAKTSQPVEDAASGEVHGEVISFTTTL